MTFSLIRRRVLTSLAIAGAILASAVSIQAISQPTDVHSVIGSPQIWAATKWSTADLALFGGMPKYQGDRKNLLILRYSFFVANYDGDRISPLWVAHINKRDALAKATLRTDKHDLKWHRLPGFYADRNVIAFTNARHLPFAVDDSYTNCNPPELDGSPGSPTDVTRGHNASNLEMKLQGTEDEGVIAQHESFSLANVSPQTQRHNAPMWAQLENDCLIWAAKLGDIAIITGPVYALQSVDPVSRQPMPAPVSRQLYITGTKGPQIEMPTHFFKVIIGRMDGKLAAIGFLVPHLSTLAKNDFKKYAVPISVIEKVTQLTFMPEAELPAYKDAVDDRWLPVIP
jgi:DNA/RNA endonuclease G (NUC1)